VKDAETAADTKPVMNNAATISSGNPFVSIENEFVVIRQKMRKGRMSHPCKLDKCMLPEFQKSAENKSRDVKINAPEANPPHLQEDISAKTSV
jgi:hypothetical protein